MHPKGERLPTLLLRESLICIAGFSEILSTPFSTSSPEGVHPGSFSEGPPIADHTNWNAKAPSSSKTIQ